MTNTKNCTGYTLTWDQCFFACKSEAHTLFGLDIKSSVLQFFRFVLALPMIRGSFWSDLSPTQLEATFHVTGNLISHKCEQAAVVHQLA